MEGLITLVYSQCTIPGLRPHFLPHVHLTKAKVVCVFFIMFVVWLYSVFSTWYCYFELAAGEVLDVVLLICLLCMFRGGPADCVWFQKNVLGF